MAAAAVVADGRLRGKHRLEGILDSRESEALGGARLVAPVADRMNAIGAPTQPELTRSPDNGDWRVDVGGSLLAPRSTLDVMANMSQKVSAGELSEYQAVPLGFTPLDRSLGGGIRPGELLLIGGAQGTGKTTLALQMARNIALGGQASVLYICFEHDDEYLLNRMIAMESVLSGPMPPTSGVRLQDVRREVLGTWMAQAGQQGADLSANPRLRPALERIARYGSSLFLMRGSQAASTVDNMRRLIERYRSIEPGRQLAVVVDYLQKVPVIPDPATETEKVTVVVNGLKDVALSQHVPLISIVAADKEGLKASRLRNHHLRGSSAINYEADIILILNEKYNIVAKANIEFNPYQAQRFRDWIVLTVEKNRAGAHSIDLEFEKHFEFSVFDPSGRQVTEKLIEERLYND
ncbi:MAG: DnaB helicase C-terminal domain-containing protein [Chloroflexota bacterium]|nr:DnaB helicase C-terminal domain-containing protein [Chloroflexota bacterium]